ncbi:MAG: ATP synthase F1 subunit epsilon [Bdellovibrionota bacterium]
MLTLSIVTPDRRVVGPVPVKSVTLPGEKGEMTVLPGHARLLSTMNTGILVFELDSGKKEVAAVSSGFVEVSQDKVTVLADTLEMAHEIDVDRARKAQSTAEEKLKAKANFENDMLKWQRKLQRAQIRQQAAEFLLPPH